MTNTTTRKLTGLGAALLLAAFLLLQGVETLSLRLDRHAENTKKVVEYLNRHPLVESISHPSLPDHPDQVPPFSCPVIRSHGFTSDAQHIRLV